MMLPKDRPLYTNLGTSFTDFDQLLAELKGTRATGYINVTFPDYEGIILLSAGDVVNALEQGEESRVSGSNARSAVLNRVKGKGGSISVYGLAPELVGLLSVLLESEVIYKSLETSFANPDRLVAKLRDDGHTGHLEFELPEGRGEGIIFMRSGQVIEAVLAHEGQASSGAPVAETIIQAAASYGATFHVYRAMSGRPAAAVATPAAAVERPSEAAALPANVTPIAKTEGPPKADSKALLAFWSEMLARAEGAVDKLSSEGRFADAFREVLGGVVLEAGAEGIDAGRIDLEPAGHRVPSVGDQVGVARLQRFVQLEAGYRSAGTGGHFGAFLDGDHQGGPADVLHDAAGLPSRSAAYDVQFS